MNYLDRLVKEISEGVCAEPPKGSFSTADLAAKAGLSDRRAGDILLAKLRKKEISRVWVRRGCAKVAYWMEGKS